jgi:hypothetical protein
MEKPDTHGVTGAYSHPPCGWDKVLAYAATRPNLRRFAENYHRTRHPACLNAIMSQADSGLWLVWYSAPSPQKAREGSSPPAQGNQG